MVIPSFVELLKDREMAAFLELFSISGSPLNKSLSLTAARKLGTLSILVFDG